MKRIVVVVRAVKEERVAEALRAAVGLSLRGDRITVVIMPAAKSAAMSTSPAIRRALATLPMLGHSIVWEPEGVSEGLSERLRQADAVEVWS